VGQNNANSGRQALAFVAFGALYYLLAVYAVSLPFQTRLPLYIWPAHGLALGVLLVAPLRRCTSSSCSRSACSPPSSSMRRRNARQ
jgi:hypothetical protein